MRRPLGDLGISQTPGGAAPADTHVAIVVPMSWAFNPKQFTVSMEHLDREGLRCSSVYVEADTIYKMRNEGVQRARALEATHILYADADMAFKPISLKQLLAHELPIVGGLCRARRPPFDATLWMEAGENKYYRIPPQGNGLLKVHATGGAFLLVQMSVFDELDRQFPGVPHFINRETFVVMRPSEDGEPEILGESEYMSEDIWFCRQAGKAGFELRVDQDLKIGHVVTAIIMDDDEHHPTIMVEKGVD
jgi:hypothetical protein